jgi:hypothetical protein
MFPNFTERADRLSCRLTALVSLYEEPSTRVPSKIFSSLYHVSGVSYHNKFVISFRAELLKVSPAGLDLNTHLSRGSLFEPKDSEII